MEDGPTPLYQAEPGPPFWDDTLSSPSNSTIDEDWSSFYPTLSPQHGCVPWTNQPTASISSAPLSWLDSVRIILLLFLNSERLAHHLP